MREMPEEKAREMTEAIFQGRKIDAIKIYREASGMGLKDAKEFVDDLERRLREECPEKFSSAAAKTGCGVVFFLGGLLALAAASLVA